MLPFLVGHATHPDWRVALPLALAQIDARLAERAQSDGHVAGDPTLGFVYFTDHYADEAALLLEELRRRWPAVAWVGTVGVGVSASGVEYIDEPALAVMMAAMPVGRFRVFSGKRPLAGFDAHTALVHADPDTPDLAELIGEMSDRTASGYLFGGLCASRQATPQVAGGQVVHGGLSGVAFSSDVPILSRVTQGCQPAGPTRRITACERNVVLTLDGQPALDCLRDDRGLDLSRPQQAVSRLRATLAGLTDPHDAPAPGRPMRPGAFGPDVRVRHLAGIDMARRGVALADRVEEGMTVTFCERHVEAARRDLVRICAEIREELDPAPHDDEVLAGRVPALAGGGPEPGGRQIVGALYVSCAGRGGPHFGGPSAELQVIARALGDVPLVGYFAGGEIGHRHLYGYTGVLTVFCTGDATG